MKANMIIVRGRDKEIRGEDWNKLEHTAYTSMIAREVKNCDSYFTVIVLVPGRSPIKCDGVFYRGCNCMAISFEVCELIR